MEYINYKFIIIVLFCASCMEQELILNDDSRVHSQN